MPIRLVKGAYWDAETVHADAHTYNSQFLNKEETDLHFRQMVLKIRHGDHVQLCLPLTTFQIMLAEVARNKFLNLLCN